MSDETVGRDSFARAYRGLREELSKAGLPPGSQIRVDETAARFGISATPVREALSRLAGERLVHDRRRQGYFVPRYSGSQLAQLFWLSEMYLVAAVRTSPVKTNGDRDGALDLADLPYTCKLSRLFIAILAGAGNPLLLDAGALTIERLAWARRIESAVVGLPNESEKLWAMAKGSDTRAFLSALRAYHRARRAYSDKIAAALDNPKGEYIPDMV